MPGRRSEQIQVLAITLPRAQSRAAKSGAEKYNTESPRQSSERFNSNSETIHFANLGILFVYGYIRVRVVVRCTYCTVCLPTLARCSMAGSISLWGRVSNPMTMTVTSCLLPSNRQISSSPAPQGSPLHKRNCFSVFDFISLTVLYH